MASSSAVDVDTGQHLLSDDSVAPSDAVISERATYRMFTTPIPVEEVCCHHWYVSTTDLHIYILDVVPPVHVV